jgi:RHS repeat-associated protein
MVAADETILLIKQSGKHCRREEPFAPGTVLQPAEFEKSVDVCNLQRSRNADQKFGISERLFIDHYSLVIERCADAHGNTRLVTDVTGKVVEDMNYGAFGDALGFNASTALTTYLYSSMPFDAASGNYYDDARFYNTGTGEFTQADYGNYGHIGDPMSYLPYTFTGGDPINMLDLNGHSFGIPSLSIAISIGATLGGLSTGVANYATGRPITEGLATGIFLGAVLAPLAVASPLIGVGLAGLGVYEGWSTAWQVWENPRPTPGQLTASLVLFGASLAGGAFAADNLAAHGWYNPVFERPPTVTTPLMMGSSLGELFSGVPDGAMVHVSPASLETLSTEGVRPSLSGKSYWFRWGDVKGMTLSQYRSLVGPLAAGGQEDANTFVFKLPDGGAAFARGGLAPFGFQEYVSFQTVIPDAGGLIVPGGGDDED